MLELVLCSILTVLPDFLYRRFVQGKRIGREITLFSVWYELRWGITACFMLTVTLITIIFYYHPSSTSVTSMFRAIPILPETSGRVSEIFVDLTDTVRKGDPIFKLDNSAQRAAVDTAQRRIAEIDANLQMARADLAAADAQIGQAKSAEQQALDELRTKQELYRRNPGNVAFREIEQLEVAARGRRAAVEATEASRLAAETRVTTLLPAQRETARSSLEEAEIALRKTTVYAGVDGRIEQFVLRVGDIVNPLMRPAGVLIPAEAGRAQLQAGFGQIEGQVLKVGLVGEATCVSKPMSIIPLVVIDVQDAIATGQVRTGEQLIEVQRLGAPGTILVFLKPLFEGGMDGVVPGSSCIANIYTSNHDRLTSEQLGLATWLYLHIVDATAMVHALLLRVQALLLPVKTLVFGGH
ncbi:MAG: HlyD family secretion protein [Pseudorhodoplanes sp.]|nr:HlyD family secretion protein [Pseudorhodoplanes sp.]